MVSEWGPQARVRSLEGELLAAVQGHGAHHGGSVRRFVGGSQFRGSQRRQPEQECQSCLQLHHQLKKLKRTAASSQVGCWFVALPAIDRSVSAVANLSRATGSPPTVSQSLWGTRTAGAPKHVSNPDTKLASTTTKLRAEKLWLGAATSGNGAHLERRLD